MWNQAAVCCHLDIENFTWECNVEEAHSPGCLALHDAPSRSITVYFEAKTQAGLTGYQLQISTASTSD